MGTQTDTRRRTLGVIFLGAALFMLVAGETALRNHFSAVGLLVYWCICLAFTFLAIVVAFLDAAATGRRAREQQRQLLEGVLHDIVREKESKTGNPGDIKNPTEADRDSAP